MIGKIAGHTSERAKADGAFMRNIRFVIDSSVCVSRCTDERFPACVSRELQQRNAMLFDRS